MGSHASVEASEFRPATKSDGCAGLGAADEDGMIAAWAAGPSKPSSDPRRAPPFEPTCGTCTERSRPSTCGSLQAARIEAPYCRDREIAAPLMHRLRCSNHAMDDAPQPDLAARGPRRVTGGTAAAVALGALVLATPAHSQDIGDIRELSGKELNEAWANRATTADEALANLVRGHLAEQNIGTPATAVRFIPYRNVPIEEECRTILKGKDFRLTADELPSTVTLKWGRAPASGVTVGTALHYRLDGQYRKDNALKFFSYTTLVAEPSADGRYHAQALIPAGPTLSQLAAIGKLYESGKTVQLDRYNSDYDSLKGTITAVKLDDAVQRVVRDHFLPLESFVSHPKHSPRRNKSKFKVGYIRGFDVAFIVRSRVYDVFLIRGDEIRLSRPEPWTFIRNAKIYNNSAHQERLEELCITDFPTTTSEATKRLSRPGHYLR